MSSSVLTRRLVQGQLGSVVAAQQEMEKHLHAAHVQIEQQVLAMREEVRLLVMPVRCRLHTFSALPSVTGVLW